MKKQILVLVFASLIAVSFVSNAGAVLFDPTGNAGTNQANVIDVAVWDWAPSSALAQNANSLGFVGQNFDLLAHADLGNFLDASNNTINGTGLNTNYEITFVTKFSETVTSVVPGTAVFGVDTSQPNFFEMYLDSSIDADNDLTGDGSAGTGFNDGDTGAPILTASITSGTSNFTVTNPNGGLLDQSPDGDDASGAPNFNNPQNTIAGGGFTFTYYTVMPTQVDPDYFLEPVDPFFLDLVFTTQQVLPFVVVDPANNYWNGSGYTLPNLRPTNGDPSAPIGEYDLLLQFDANQSQTLGVIPEPGTIMLLGLGLLGMAGVGRKRLLIK